MSRSRQVLGKVAIAALALSACGVSGKVAHTAVPATEAQPTTTTTVPEQTVPATTDTTAPDSTGSTDTTETAQTTAPDSTNPLGRDQIKSTLIRIYKQAGFTDKEARCVADLVVKQSGGETFDPGKLDISKLTSAARRCFGADGVPGGSD